MAALALYSEQIPVMQRTAASCQSLHALPAHDCPPDIQHNYITAICKLEVTDMYRAPAVCLETSLVYFSIFNFLGT